MVRDRAAPLSTVSLDWRMATWIGVAQLLDRAGAREIFGPPRFALARPGLGSRLIKPEGGRENPTLGLAVRSSLAKLVL